MSVHPIHVRIWEHVTIRSTCLRASVAMITQEHCVKVSDQPAGPQCVVMSGLSN